MDPSTFHGTPAQTHEFGKANINDIKSLLLITTFFPSQKLSSSPSPHSHTTKTEHVDIYQLQSRNPLDRVCSPTKKKKKKHIRQTFSPCYVGIGRGARHKVPAALRLMSMNR